MMSNQEILGSFNNIASKLEANRDKVLDALIQIETLQMAHLEFNKTLRALRTYSRELPYLVDRVPLGKVGVVLPFNTPLYGMILYAFGPLLVGNRVFVKPSSLSYEICEFFYTSYFKDEIGDFLTLHTPGKWFLKELCLEKEKVQAVSFTGQWHSVQGVLNVIPNDVRLIYSGSGYNPFIVLSNADIEDAIKFAIRSRLWNSGQDCLATERFYIEDEVFDEFVEGLINVTKNIKCGENSDVASSVGPLISGRAVENVMSIIEEAGDSANVLLGGEIDGLLVTPFIFEAEPNSPLVQSEKYAPIFVVVRVKHRNSLPTFANELDFALGATVWGEDESIVNELQAAHIAHNSSVLDIEDEDAHVPFGGYKNSGFVLHKSQNYQKSGPILYSVETSVPRT